MAIQILPPQLANQIAAGEVVERPASVVKELVENSLDAGATCIQVEIEKGGAKRIAIRDNGCGISKEDLPLALARHATSKIVTLDDLTAITSLGFRGEALASISSVSRLTLTSRTEQQQEAWQAYAEGREMKILLKPAAHPCGSTLEVLDLFYNTPARRKFLRTEKTEFMQIDEVIRRIALVRFDTDITLIHNGKKVRQYRPANNEQQKVRRLTAICSQAFTDQAVQIEWQHQDLGLTGWIASPQAAGSASELQYCYVNGRMMRDKLISHAIRQAYQDKPGADQLPAYVLFLRIDPHQVDVNVHPAKYEVRFHQSRLVHDFIYQGVLSALQQIEEQGPDGATYTDTDKPRTEPRRQENRQTAGRNMFAESAGSSKKAPATGIPGSTFRPRDADIYQKMMAATAVREPGSGCREIPPDWQAATPPEASQHSFGRVLTVCQQRFAITENAHQLLAVALPIAEQRVLCIRLTPDKEPLKPQPLLIPLRVSLTKEEKRCLLHYRDLLDRFGIQLHYDARHVIISAVPLPLRSRNLQILIPEMLGYFASQTTVNQDAFARWLSVQNLVSSTAWNHSQAITLLADLERLDPSVVRHPPKGLVFPIDLNPVFKMLTDE